MLTSVKAMEGSEYRKESVVISVSFGTEQTFLFLSVCDQINSFFDSLWSEEKDQRHFFVLCSKKTRDLKITLI